MYKKILIKYGDLTLKGKNKNIFVNKVYGMVSHRFNDTSVTIEKTNDRMVLDLNGFDYKEAITKLDTVSGIQTYVLVAACPTDIEAIKELALKVAIDATKDSNKTFKVDTKRSYKQFPMNSMDFNKDLSGHILTSIGEKLKVSMKNAELLLKVEIRREETYIYNSNDRIYGMGGFPCGVAGRGLLMISGGIDSPVAGYLMQKQGVEIEAIHFESSPMTSIESAQKVIDLTKKMSKFAPKQKMKLHMVHFSKAHQELLSNIPEAYNITVMRRLMYKIAEQFNIQRKIKVICNGESIGQVASQTLGSMEAVNHVTNMPIIRPLAIFDKKDIIKIAKKIDTYDLSILPFEDCCTVYVPKAPSTNPKVEKCLRYEQSIEFDTLVEECVNNISTIVLSPKYDLDVTVEGFVLEEILKNK